MPDSVRQARVRAQQIDYDQMRADLVLLEQLANLDLKMGRKKIGYRDQRADFSIRHKEDKEVKAELSLRG